MLEPVLVLRPFLRPNTLPRYGQDRPSLVDPLIHCWKFGPFPLGAVAHSAAVDICVHFFLYTHFQLFWFFPYE